LNASGERQVLPLARATGSATRSRATSRIFRGDPNLFGYVADDPVNFLDPLGFEHVQEPGFTKPLSEAGGLRLPLRLPDYIGVNVNIAIPTPWTGTLVGWSGSATVDRYGRWYGSYLGGGVGKSLTVVSGSFTANWLDQRGKPTPKTLRSFLTQHGINSSAGYWGGATQSYTPGSGWATGIGLVSPQIGASYNYSFQGASSKGVRW
jgi:hypothetical protein